MIGYGTKDKTPIDAIQFAINSGYTLIDTKNTNKSLLQYKKLRFERNKIMFCSKLVGEENKYVHDPKNVRTDVLKSLDNIGLTYWDIFYIHTTFSYNSTPILDTYDELIKLKNEGYIKNIGLSNVTFDQLNAVCLNRVKPDYIQIEIHPYLTENKIVSFCILNDIKIIAHSPFGSNILFKDMNKNKVLIELSKKYNQSVYSIILKWHVSRGIIPIPSSKNKENIKNNININFVIDNDDLCSITNLNKNKRVYIKPNHHEYRYKQINKPFPEWKQQKNNLCGNKDVDELIMNGYKVDKLYNIDDNLYDICSKINIFMSNNEDKCKKEKLYERDYQIFYKGDEIDILINNIKSNRYLNNLAENYLKKKKITKQVYITKNTVNNDLLAKHSSLYHRDSQKQPNMKVVIYLNNVTAENGALNIVTNESNKEELTDYNLKWYLETAFRNKTPRTTKEELIKKGYYIKTIFGNEYTCIIFDGTIIHNGGHIYKGFRNSIYIEYF